MGRIYTVTAENITLTNAGGDVDVVEVSPADDKPCRFLGYEIDNVGGTADAGDAQEEFLRLAVIRGHTSSGSGGSAATPVAVDRGDAAAGFAAEVNNTTIASAGSTVTPWAGGWNVRQVGPVPFGPDPYRTGPKASQADTTMVLRMLSTLADDVVVSVTLWVEED